MATEEECNDGIDTVCCKSYYDLDSGTATSTYQYIRTRLNDDRSLNIMGDETVADEEECDNIHILQEDNILCNEKVISDIPENSTAPRTGTPNENYVNDSDNHETIIENEETSCNAEVVHIPRKMGRNTAKWNKSVKKRKVQCGEEYTIVTGNVKRAKYVVEIQPTYSYKKKGSQHSPNLAYHFVVDGHCIRTCKNFFMKTWDINATFLTTVKKMISKETRVIEEDLRDIRDHINSFPRTDSHYCRKSNHRQFIDGGLDISQMYRLYVEEYQTEPSKLVALKHKYESLFSAQRMICVHYALLTKAVHEKRKYNCGRSMMMSKREVKENVIAASMEQPSNNIVSCFDMHAVIRLTCGNVSTFYYKRKLNVFNFTNYDATNE
ncbi:hypothetical protein PR048_005229 [Dryococelus australis]|uniref:Uncharacterized protein n=1 Tax=Dryococelus australis TaxID=614101 RepID=A0ABQ9I7L1_9NEOP|nr:hypothetical protein PR048_005229 [Dryococelus australis]